MLARDAGLGYTARRDGAICTDGIPSLIVANSDNYDDKGFVMWWGSFLVAPKVVVYFHVLVEERTTDVVNF